MGRVVYDDDGIHIRFVTGREGRKEAELQLLIPYIRTTREDLAERLFRAAQKIMQELEAAIENPAARP